jgi:hypothetical protein
MFTRWSEFEHGILDMRVSITGDQVFRTYCLALYICIWTELKLLR